MRASYTARVVSRHTGKTLIWRNRFAGKRALCVQARDMARARGMTGRLKVSLLKHIIPEGGTMGQAEKDGRVIYGETTCVADNFRSRCVIGIEASKRQLKRWNKENRP